MDYVPLPLNPSGAPLAVPLLSRTGYDDSIDFADYPERQGWGKQTAAQWTAIFENPTPEFQAFLQRWLLFAPLQAFSGSELDMSDVTHANPDTGGTELTLQMLPRLAERWLSYTPEEVLTLAGGGVDLLSAATTVHQILSTPDPGDAAGRYMDDTKRYTLQEFMLAPGHKDPCHPLVSIAISSMLTFIMSATIRAMIKVTGEAVSDNARVGHSMVFEWRSPIWAELLRRGWCPFELTPMSVRFNTTGLAFMSRVERPIPSRNHEIATDYPRAGHSSHQDTQLCSSFSCVHRRLQDATYATAHAQGCQGCLTVVALLEDMSAILMGGSFPLIVSADGGDCKEHIRLVPWKPGVRYIAISHVWSDGLGNVRENGIPRCQLQRLSRYVRNLLDNAADAPLFWLDTICVPPDAICKSPEATHERKLQDLAIANMRETYGRSTATLVLDAWLFSAPSAGMTDAEKMMRIFSCTWNSRLWTYQEGALPDALYFQFKDAAEDLDQMKARLESEMERDPALGFTLGERLLIQHNSLRGFRDLYPRSEDFILFVLGNMAFRSTSVATDEAICLSTLMGLDMDAMLSVEAEQRMAAFWRQVPCAPSSLLLASVPTLDEPGLSWAPYSSLLVKDRLSETGSLNTLSNVSLRRPTTLTARGLEIDSPGLLIRCDGFRPEGTFLVQDDCGFNYHVKTMLHKTVSTEAFQEAVAVLVVHSYDKVHHCVERDGVLQPLLLMQPHDDGLMVGRKIGMAVIRCLTGPLDAALLQRMASYDMFEDGIVGDATTQKLQITMGRNVLSETWCVA